MKNLLNEKTALKAGALIAAGTVCVSAMPFGQVTAIAADEASNPAGTAGVVATLGSFVADAISNADASAVVSDNVTEEVGAVETEEVSEWANRLMVNVDSEVNVRDAATTDGNIAGKLRSGDVAEFTEEVDGWYAITSGNLTGYIRADYVVIGDEAEALADTMYDPTATSTENGLRIRTEASTDAGVYDVLDEGESVTVADDAEAAEGWVAVTYDGNIGYVNEQYVTVETVYSTGITAEEEQAIKEAEAAAKAAEEAAEAEAAAAKAAASASTSSSASTSTSTATTNAAVSASTDERTMLAAIASLEAGSYDGMVAVCAVIMNRVNSSAYPSSISGVITQSGQFSTLSAMNSRIANGISSTAYAAADAALAGSDPTGGCLSFRAASSGYAGINIGGNVFF